MSIKDYTEVLRFAINMAIHDIETDDMQKPNANEEYLSGVTTGLMIALDKIDKSMFLAE